MPIFMAQGPPCFREKCLKMNVFSGFVRGAVDEVSWLVRLVCCCGTEHLHDEVSLLALNWRPRHWILITCCA